MDIELNKGIDLFTQCSLDWSNPSIYSEKYIICLFCFIHICSTYIIDLCMMLIITKSSFIYPADIS